MIFSTVNAARRKAVRALVYGTGLPRRYYVNIFSGSPDVCFIWIPKSAGTSVYKWLESQLGMLKLKERISVKGGFSQCGPVTFGHMHYEALLDQKLVSMEFHKRAYRFCFVRNPYDRAASLYYYLSKNKRYKGSFSDFLRRVESGVEPLGLYNSVGLSQANPQSSWIISSNGQVLVEHIFKVEDFQSAQAELAVRLGIEVESIHANRSERRENIASLFRSKEDVEIVKRIYEKDFAMFGYSMEPPF